MTPALRFPIFAGPAVIAGGRATFRLAGGTTTVRAPRRLLSVLAARCDGDTSLAEIRRDLAATWRAADVDRFLSMLAAEGALVDADSAALQAWRQVENPLRAPARASRPGRRAASKPGGRMRKPPRFALRALLERRRSAPGFSGDAVPLAAIRAMLWAAYGMQAGRVNGSAHRTVASGGALFPLRMHLINLRPTAGLAAGVYAVDFRRDGAVGLRRSGKAVRQAYRAFGDPGLLRNAQAVIVVSGEFAVTAAKYGSRSLLYVPLEAGHAAQNAMLAAADLGLGAREIGGFIEQRLRATLGAGEALTPLTTIAIGTAAAEPAPGPAIEFSWIESEAPFALGMARLEGADEDDAGWGRDREPLVAFDKAVAEAWERSACGMPGDVYRARGADLRDVLDPAQIIAYRPAQYARRGFPFRPYSDRRQYGWKNGTDYVSGRPVPLLAECVYFRHSLPSRLQRTAYTSATSSGVAAAGAREQAIERAVLELVERDAFMAAWLERREAPAIARRSLPGDLQARIAKLENLGWRVVLKDISRDLAPVVLAFAQHAGRGMTRVAAHAAFEPAAAAEHALRELESLVYLSAEPPVRIAAAAVRTPADHAALYAQRRFFRRADRLARGAAERRLAAVGAGLPARWRALCDLLFSRGRRLVCVDLTPRGARLAGDARPLQVFRAIVPGLLPMTFGCGLEPLGLVSSGELDQALFPHPFA